MPAILEFRRALAIVTLDRADCLNALNRELIEQIGMAIDEVEASDARAIAFVGAGDRAFCAGADVDGLLSDDASAMRDGIRFGQLTFAKLDGLKIPSIAVVNGFALGGGLELAMACTFRIATGTARFGLPEVKLGLLPGYGGTQRLPRLVGQARALELILSGRIVDADEALSIGLIHEISVKADLLETAAEFAGRFTGHSLRAVELARQAVQRGCAVSLEDGLKIEADLISLALQTHDAREGISAFLEKRKPAFKDR
jgi:enoyl-CoA hydratase